MVWDYARVGESVKILGLTGSIAAGKTYVSGFFLKHDLGVFSADEEVGSILATKDVIKKIILAFPEVKTGEVVDRKQLSDIVFKDSKQLSRLEKIIHPLVERGCQSVIKRCEVENKKAVLLEVPLLFESNYYQSLCDVVITVVTSNALQKKRALKRDGMTSSKLDSILQQQLSDKERVKRSNYVIKNDQDINDIDSQVRAILKVEGLL
jgi:dephospho-CoA kinase